MTTIEIREVHGDELFETVYALMAYAFYPTPSQATRDLHAQMLPTAEERYHLVLFEDGVPLATGNNIPMTQNVRGKIFPMAGVAGVTTHPTARRKGYARQVLNGLFKDMRDKGQPFSCLYPFRESFYGRLGYINFPLRRYVKIQPNTLLPLLNADLKGEYERHEIRDGLELFYEFAHLIQPQIHGMGLFPPKARTWFRERNLLWVVVAHHEGEMVGMMTYTITGYREDTVAPHFYYKNITGRFLLMQWMAYHADQVKSFILRLRPDDYIENWAYDLDAVVQPLPNPQATGVRIDPQGRVVIVSEIGGMQAGEGKFSARIQDEQCPWNNGVYTFEGLGGVLQVKDGATPDCNLTINGLSALVYGGHDPAEFALRGWGNPPPAVQDAMRRVFPPARPYLHENF